MSTVVCLKVPRASSAHAVDEARRRAETGIMV